MLLECASSGGAIERLIDTSERDRTIFNSHRNRSPPNDHSFSMASGISLCSGHGARLSLNTTNLGDEPSLADASGHVLAEFERLRQMLGFCSEPAPLIADRFRLEQVIGRGGHGRGPPRQYRNSRYLHSYLGSNDFPGALPCDQVAAFELQA